MSLKKKRKRVKESLMAASERIQLKSTCLNKRKRKRRNKHPILATL